jgi:hypothetical protein
MGHAVGGDDKRSIKRGVSSRIIQERSSSRSIKRMPEFRRETPLFRNIHKFFFREARSRCGSLKEFLDRKKFFIL